MRLAQADGANPREEPRLTTLGRLLFRSGRGADSLLLVDQGLALAPRDQPLVHRRGVLMAAHAALNRGQRGAPVLALLDEAQAICEQAQDAAGLARTAGCRADTVRATGSAAGAPSKRA